MIKKRVVVLLSVTLFAVVVGYTFFAPGDYHPNWKHEDIFKTKEIGERISLAIIEFYKSSKKFPENLDMLVPKYLDRIEQPTVGKRKWEIEQHSEGFSLIAEGIDAESEPIMILEIKRRDLSTDWYFDSK